MSAYAYTNIHMQKCYLAELIKNITEIFNLKNVEFDMLCHPCFRYIFQFFLYLNKPMLNLVNLI